MEPQTIDGHDVYRCFVCGREDKVVLLEDSRRWWGAFHLPFIDVFIHPTAAFRQLNEHPNIPMNLLFFTAAYLLEGMVNGSSLAQALHQFIRYFPPLGPLSLVPPLIGVAGFFYCFVKTLTLHGAAQAVGLVASQPRRATFKSLWAVMMFMTSWTCLFSIFTRSPDVKLGLLGWDLIWSLWAVMVLYRFSVPESVGTWILSWIFQWILLAVVGLFGTLAVFRHPRIHRKQAASAPMRQAHLPADYQWQVESMDGRAISMNEMRGKVIFLNFWATWCLPCRMEMPGIQSLYERFKENPHVVFMIVSEESAGDVHKFMRRAKYALPIYIAKSPTPSVFEHEGIPQTYIISPQGAIVAQQTGAGEWDTEDNVRLLNDLSRSAK